MRAIGKRMLVTEKERKSTKMETRMKVISKETSLTEEEHISGLTGLGMKETGFKESNVVMVSGLGLKGNSTMVSGETVKQMALGLSSSQKMTTTQALGKIS